MCPLFGSSTVHAIVYGSELLWYDGMKCKRFFSLGLWLLVAQLCHHLPHVSGQQGKLWFISRVNTVFIRIAAAATINFSLAWVQLLLNRGRLWLISDQYHPVSSTKITHKPVFYGSQEGQFLRFRSAEMYLCGETNRWNLKIMSAASYI